MEALMAAGLPESVPVELPQPAAEPVYFGAADRPWFGWVHRPAPARARGVALVLVPPFGYEAVCAHVALRHLAEDAAAAGVTCVRFDLDGTGDSAGDDRDPDRVGAWCASIAGAIDLARGAGADRVVLAGVRFGATLAVRVAATRSDVAGVVAIAPVVAGKKWLREMRALQQALGLQTTEDEALGFPLAPQTREVIAAIELERLADRPAPAMLLIDRHDLPGNERWAGKLRALGVDVDQRRLPGYVEMVLDPHKAEVPREIVAATIEFAAARPPLTGVPPAIVPSAAHNAQLGDVVEEPVAIGPLAAIASRPARQARPRRALVLLNSGCVRRIGPNRMYVAMARRCAADGALVVRVDLSGIGDTPARPGESERVVYPEHALVEIAELIAWCRRAGADQVVLGGLCSGGYYAVEAALAGQPLAGILPINPGLPETPDEVQPYRAHAEMTRYLAALRDPAKWKKLLDGSADVRRLARIASMRVREAAASRAKDLARRLGVPLADDFGTALVRLAKRGTTITYIFCAAEPGLVHLRERAGASLTRLERRGQLALRIIDGPDHTFTPVSSHAWLVDEVAAAMRRVK